MLLLLLLILQSSLQNVHLLVCRQIELQQQHEDTELRELWNELRQKMLSVFHASSTQPTVTSCAGGDPGATSSVHSTTVDSIHELIERFDIVH